MPAFTFEKISPPVRILCRPLVIERISPNVVEGAATCWSIKMEAVPNAIPPALGAMRISDSPGNVASLVRRIPTSEFVTGSCGDERCFRKL